MLGSLLKTLANLFSYAVELSRTLAVEGLTKLLFKLLQLPCIDLDIEGCGGL